MDRDKIREQINNLMGGGWDNPIACDVIADWIISCLVKKQQKVFADYGYGWNDAIDETVNNLEGGVK